MFCYWNFIWIKLLCYFQNIERWNHAVKSSQYTNVNRSDMIPINHMNAFINVCETLNNRTVCFSLQNNLYFTWDWCDLVIVNQLAGLKEMNVIIFYFLVDKWVTLCLAYKLRNIADSSIEEMMQTMFMNHSENFLGDTILNQFCLDVCEWTLIQSFWVRR